MIITISNFFFRGLIKFGAVSPFEIPYASYILIREKPPSRPQSPTNPRPVDIRRRRSWRSAAVPRYISPSFLSRVFVTRRVCRGVSRNSVVRLDILIQTVILGADLSSGSSSEKRNATAVRPFPSVRVAID